jgi:predicted RecB family nuclease
MHISGTRIELSASDLSQFLACRQLTALNLAVAHGSLSAPFWSDPVLALLQKRGLDHERSYVDKLRAEGLQAIDLSDYLGDDAVARSLDAMRKGVDVVIQPALRHGRWFGRPDVLRRHEMDSALGSWSYQVIDTKLAKETRGGTILQLALYSELLGIVQGAVPEFFQVITPDPATPTQTFRVHDFAAYCRLIRRRLEATSLRDPELLADAEYPEPVEHCDICRWWRVCDKRRRDDDHLSLVAGISRLQSRELQSVGIKTLAQLGTMPLPLPFAPRRGAKETYARIREQARVQLEGRIQQTTIYELLPIQQEQGLARLPTPSPGDIFLDLEGYPFARDGGREYLFGLHIYGADGSFTNRSHWALSDEEERIAFEITIDEILESWASNPGMHVYHYAPYEPAALKRLMGRHATREAEIDRMLRAELFVDLYAVVRHSIRASVERYSIKDLEPFYQFSRNVELEDARTNLRVIERALELSATGAVTEQVRAAVEGYNRDDCISAFRLREWLERLRGSVEAKGIVVPRPTAKDGSPSEKLDDRARRVQALMEVLTAEIPVERADRSDDQQGRWLLAHLLDWHRRDAKAPWWEFFRLRDLSEDELISEKAAISGLSFVARVGGTTKSPIDQYAFPTQDTEVRDGDSLHLPDGTDFGSVEAIDRVARTIDVKKRGAQADVHPSAVFAHSAVKSEVLSEALLRIADDVAQGGISRGTQYRVARELLLARPPQLRTGVFQAQPGEGAVPFAVRIAAELDHAVLAIQGPPGAGKTFTGAQMIRELVRRGARVGVTAVSHKVIRNLLDAAVKAAAETRLQMKCAQKVTTKSGLPSDIDEITDNGEVIARLGDGRVHVVGGTPWLWARPDSRAVLDVLFVDEAGQMSLANVLAASQAAHSVVLLGDPQQLEQPQQGSHPTGTDVSALEHMLQGHKTISNDRGIFLPETWRLAPSICKFTSEVFYEGRLHARAGLDRQMLVGTPPFEGAGLWVVPVTHDGNQNSSREEVEVIDRIIGGLLRPNACWANQDGDAHTITPDDILIVAPYNSQVSLLAERLATHGVRIGTVDKFQGQEAPVVIYSMATSRPEDAPRGMEFLYSLNRLNVATSRARCASILVASPRLFEPECKSPRQMQLANALCRYLELAQSVSLATAFTPEFAHDR